ncbi:hypothetical protein, partial [Streptosporangium sp. NPDC049304]|uniref:hypothetical protein n=1 Tax=Streptosporangium sp. NPDC049304 TaxID=3154830 RepID=UPI00343129D4
VSSGGGGGLHAEQEFEYFRPLRIGETLTARKPRTPPTGFPAPFFLRRREARTNAIDVGFLMPRCL